MGLQGCDVQEKALGRSKLVHMRASESLMALISGSLDGNSHISSCYSFLAGVEGEF